MTTTAGFWLEGRSGHLEALREAERQELAALHEQMFFASPEEQVALEIEVKKVRKAYREERKSTKKNLYFGSGMDEPEGRT